MHTTIRRIFSLKKSLAITIPRSIVKDLKLQPNDLCVVRRTGRRVFEVVVLKTITEAYNEAETIKSEDTK